VTAPWTTVPREVGAGLGSSWQPCLRRERLSGMVAHETCKCALQVAIPAERRPSTHNCASCLMRSVSRVQHVRAREYGTPTNPSAFFTWLLRSRLNAFGRVGPSCSGPGRGAPAPAPQFSLARRAARNATRETAPDREAATTEHAHSVEPRCDIHPRQLSYGSVDEVFDSAQ
jgi:hypothetical protein